MIIPDNIDYDRLEKTVSLLVNKKRCDRRQGKTFAYIMLMTGEVELSDCYNFVYVGENEKTCAIVAKEFAKMLTSMYDKSIILHQSSDRIKLATGQTFFFTHAGCGPEFWRGVQVNRIFFDVSDEKMHFFNSAQETEQLIINMRRSLMCSGGDII